MDGVALSSVNHPVLPDKVRNLAATPSVYGFIVWVLAFLLYYNGPIPWNRPTANLWIIFIIGTVCFLSSALFSAFVLNTKAFTPAGWWIVRSARQPSLYFILALHLAGLLGVGKYIADFGRSMGDIALFQEALIYQSHLIRMEAESATSYGFQLSYFGWVAIGLSILYKSPYAWKKRAVMVLSLIQLCTNMVFIDRTRPSWIIFVGIVLIIITSYRLSTKRLVALALSVPAGFILLFVVIGAWIGKTDFNEAFKSNSTVSVLEGPIYYASCGFAYLSWASDSIEPSPEIAQRTLYPLYRVWEVFDPSRKPPSQINEFVNVPMPTNVGTLIEPFLRDGGLLFAFVGALIHSFGFDLLAAVLRRQGSVFGFFLLANLCFVNFIGFFTPKFNTFPIWLFFLIWLLASLFSVIDPSRVRR
jgi:oligosaccharide repeat unit polymerase